MHKRQLTIVGIILIAATILFAITTYRQQAQDKSQTQDDKERAALLKMVQENGDPIAEFDAPEPVDEKKRKLRKARGVSFNFKGSISSLGERDKKILEINENSPLVSFAGLSFNLRDQPAFPVEKSPQIVLGKVTKASAFLSDDRTDIYSDFEFNVETILFEFNVETILKDDGKLLAPAPSTVTLFRWGGKVRFPSGKMLLRGTDGKPLPKADNRHLFFLTPDVPNESFYINVAYEIKDGKAMIFDGKDVEGNYLRRFKSYKQYEGMAEKDFIEAVRKVIIDEATNQRGGVKQ